MELAQIYNSIFLSFLLVSARKICLVTFPTILWCYTSPECNQGVN